jgi:ankyrin repeat protein
MHGYAAVLRLLLAQGADVNAQTAFKQTALMAAAEGGHLEAVKALVEAGADMPLDMLDYAAGRGCGAVVLYLLAKGADAKAKPGAYSSPLHDAASNGLPEVIRALVKAGADVNAVNERGETALDWAKSNGRQESVRALRQLGGLQAQQLLQLRTGQVAKLIPLLDDERFAVRQRAYRELRRFGATIAVLLRKAREEATSQQVRTQLDLLLKECEPAP